MDDTRHITQDQYNEIVLQLEELTGSDDAKNERADDIRNCVRTILGILCLDVADV